MQFPAKSFINHLEAEFIALVTEKVGEGAFKQCPSSEFEQVEEEGGKAQFYLEDDEVQEAISIKTAQFKTFINLGSQKVPSKDVEDLSDLQVKGYNFVYGFNDGLKTVQLIQGKLCRAIGVNIFFEGTVYPSAQGIYDGQCHNYEICYLNYDDINGMLYSGSNGKSSQIIEWRYDATQQNLAFIRKFILPFRSLGVAFTFKNNANLYCISKWSLHMQSQLFGFDAESTRKTKYNIPLGKVMGLCQALEIYLINEHGLHMLLQNEAGFELIKVFQSQQFATALDKIGTEHLAVGLIDGSVEIVSPKTKTVVSKIAIGYGSILAIKMIDKHRLVVSTSHKKLITLEIDNKLKQPHLKTVELAKICKNILVNKGAFICCLKGGRLEYFDVSEGKMVKQTDSIEDKMILGCQAQDQQICINKQANKYVQSIRGHDAVTVFQINKSNKISKADIIELAYPCIVLDSHGTLIACIQEVKEKSSTNKARQQLSFYDLICKQCVYTFKQLPFDNCTCIRFSQDGSKLALGFDNGVIIILDANNCKQTHEICRTQIEKIQKFSHTTSIENIIWSIDGRFLKTISLRNLLYYGLIKNNDNTYALLLHDGKKSADKQALKIAISKAEWTEMGKYNWRTAKIWSNALTFQQYEQIVEWGEYLLACVENGEMQIFANPAVEGESYSLCRWLDGPYRCKRAGKDALLIFGKGVLMSINLA